LSTWAGARLIAAGILLSRIFGLVRQRVLAYFLGDGVAADVLTAAFRIPNFLQNLFGEGVLSASFIPAYSRLLAEGKREEAGRVAGAVFSLLAMTTAVLVLGGMLATPLLVGLIAPGFEGEARALAVRLVRLIFPGVGMLVLGAWCLGILNSHRRFFLSYASPVLFNLTVIVALLATGFGKAPEEVALIAAWASVLGSALQFAVQLPSVLRLERGLRFAPDTSSPIVRGVASRFGTVVVGRGVVQVSGFVDTAIASLVSAGAVATLGYSQALSMLPVSLFGMSISAAELPAMSGEVGTRDEVAAALRQRLDRGLARIAYFVIPSAAAFVMIGGVIAAGLYQGGAFTAESARWVWAALGGSAVGLLAGTSGRLYSSASYALGDATTPLRFAVVRVLLGAVLGWATALTLPGMFGIDARWGIAMLTASSGLAAWVEFQLLRAAIARRIGRTGVPVARLATLWGCAGAAGVLGLWSARALAGQPVLLVATVAIPVFGVTYLGATRALGVDDARRA
jgi:putative peptidoglycan lipid II flippase